MFPFRDHNPSARTPYVTCALILLNIAVFALNWAQLADDRAVFLFYQDWALIPAKVSAGAGFQGFVTSVFLHGGFFHLAGNMLFLWVFGDNMEDAFGHIKFLLFYLICGAGAGLVQVLAAPASGVPIVGASGAIAGVLGGYLLLYPRAKVDMIIIFIVFFKTFTVPAWVTLGFWFALQVFNSTSVDPGGGGVAYWAHTGGFVIGLLLTLPYWLRIGGANSWRDNLGKPPHPDSDFTMHDSDIPSVRRRRR